MAYRSGKDEATGARGSSAFRAALDAEFQVKREDENIALILSCTKMKDAEEPKRRAYDLDRSGCLRMKRERKSIRWPCGTSPATLMSMTRIYPVSRT